MKDHTRPQDTDTTTREWWGGARETEGTCLDESVVLAPPLLHGQPQGVARASPGARAPHGLFFADREDGKWGVFGERVVACELPHGVGPSRKRAQNIRTLRVDGQTWGRKGERRWDTGGEGEKGRRREESGEEERGQTSEEGRREGTKRGVPG